MKKRGGLSLLYSNHLFRHLGFSLFGIFVPIYFLNLGFSLQSVFGYFLILQISLFASLLASYFISSKLGYKFSIILNAPLTIIFLLVLQFLGDVEIPLSFLAVLAGVKGGFYFIPLHSYFSKLSERKKKGEQYSNYVVAGQAAGIAGPLVGGVIASFFGFQYLFPIVLVFILFSIFPLMGLENFGPKKKVSFNGFFNFSKKNKNFFFGTFF